MEQTKRDIENKPVSVRTSKELEIILQDEKRQKEGKAIWTEDVMIRAYLEDENKQTIYRESSPFHHGFDFVTKDLLTNNILIVEMKMTNKVGGLRTYLKKTKTKGRQMSIEWIIKTSNEIKTEHPLAAQEIDIALSKGLISRVLIVANHKKWPTGWLSASFGKMGMKGFFENDFENTPEFE